MTEIKKPLGLLALERFVDTALTGSRDEITTLEMAEVIEDLTEKAICDLGGTGRDGMNLLVRVAMAARVWAQGAPLAEMGRDAVALGACVTALDEWEKSL